MSFTIAKYWEKKFKNTVPNIKGAHLNGQVSRSVVKAQMERVPVCFEAQRTGHMDQGGVNEGHLE